MSDSLFQVTGVSSGIAWDEIISKILEKSKKPATQWQKQIDTLEVKKTLYQELQSNFNKLRNSFTRLRLESAFKGKIAQYTSFSNNNVAPENIVSAKITKDAELTWWDVEVKELARAQRHMTTRFNSVSDALGISGEFRIRVGQQTTTIKVESADSLREINYKISKAVDQNGNPIAVTAKILDNRIVIESATAGKGDSGDTRGVPFTMGKGSDYYLPHSSVRGADGKYTYPPQLFRLSYEEKNADGSMYTYDYTEGFDFDYDAAIGKITWRTGAGTRRPPEGAAFNAIYSEYLTVSRNASGTQTLPNGATLGSSGKFSPPTNDLDMLPLLPTGQSYKDLSEGSFEIICNGETYRQGWDFEIETVNALGDEYQVIRWKDQTDPSEKNNLVENGVTTTYTPKRPNGTGNEASYTIRIGANNNYAYDENVFYLEPVAWNSETKTVTRDASTSAGLASNQDFLPDIFTAKEYRALTDGKFGIESGGTTYTQGDDFNITAQMVGGTLRYVVDWINSSKTPADGTSYNIHAIVENDYSDKSVLAQLGFITAGSTNDQWKFTEGTSINASDAVFEIDGVEVKRPSNTIDDVIANVTLELKGLGKVRVNVARDLEKTVEDIQTFVDAYNTAMEWINYYITQKQDGANPVNEDDHLSSLLQQSRGTTVFGVLHGDQLLSSIKNQLRTRLSNPINTLSMSLTSRKVLDPAAGMNIKSSFYIYVGGKAAKVTVDPKDSMEDIRKKITDAKNIASGDGKTASSAALGLNITIRNGQLVIDGPASSSLQYASGNRETTSATMKRSATDNFDYLSFIPVTSTPISGDLKVFSGRSPYTEGASTLYQEGVDYRVVTDTNNSGVMSSKIEWISGRGPQANQSYSVEYSYYANAVSFSEIPGSGPIGNEIAQGMNGLSFLELHQDASKISLSNLGITTESAEYGKSGYLEFDSEKFLSMMESDPDISANAMLSFMRDFDGYIGNLVDSSQTLVAGQIVTKGRIASALNTIDSEQKTLSDRITKLEKELEEKQTALYKRYSDMEVAIQKLNAQMSSVANYLNNMSNK